jgi:hypothetical protein
MLPVPFPPPGPWCNAAGWVDGRGLKAAKGGRNRQQLCYLMPHRGPHDRPDWIGKMVNQKLNAAPLGTSRPVQCP